MQTCVDPGKKFQKALKEAERWTGDLTVPFGLISQSWFKSNRAIFALSGPGKYPDLSEKYKVAKKRKHGFLYPILRAKGDLEKSITNPGDKNAVSEVVNKTILLLGTRDPKAQFHQGDGARSKMPYRPMVLLGPEQVAPSGINNRVEGFVKILEDYLLQTGKRFAERH